MSYRRAWLLVDAINQSSASRWWRRRWAAPAAAGAAHPPRPRRGRPLPRHRGRRGHRLRRRPARAQGLAPRRACPPSRARGVVCIPGCRAKARQSGNFPPNARSPPHASLAVATRPSRRNGPLRLRRSSATLLISGEDRRARRKAQPLHRVARQSRDQGLAVAVEPDVDDRAHRAPDIGDDARQHVERAHVRSAPIWPASRRGRARAACSRAPTAHRAAAASTRPARERSSVSPKRSSWRSTVGLDHGAGLGAAGEREQVEPVHDLGQSGPPPPPCPPTAARRVVASRVTSAIEWLT